MTVGNWVSFDCIKFSANLGLGCTFMPNKIQSLKKKNYLEVPSKLYDEELDVLLNLYMYLVK